MTARHWWKNCPLGQEPDPEILAIDDLEVKISPVATNISRIRKLIGSLEMCHHKAERWVSNIIEAIANGETNKGLGTRKAGQAHPTEIVSKNACAALSAWIAGCPIESIGLTIGNIPASKFLTCLGERSPLKEWQVQRVVQKIRSWTNWPWSLHDPEAQYVMLHFLSTDDATERNECPEEYKEHEDFWLKTVQMHFHNTADGREEDLSLAFAIDMLWTCHWNFVENLQVLLSVIGGTAKPEKPFGACGWNITLSPIRVRMETISYTLKAFYGHPEPDKELDSDILLLLAEPTEEKRWLALSLDKTIRLQMSL